MDHKKEQPTKLPALGRAFLWVDNKKSVERLVYALYASCALLFLADFAYHKHVYVSVENFPGFYALYGFFMCAALVVCAKAMRVFLKREETYYAPHDVEAEEYPQDQLEKINHGD